jgi:hypothetical protein
MPPDLSSFLDAYEERLASAERAALERERERFAPLRDRLVKKLAARVGTDPLLRARLGQPTEIEVVEAFGVVASTYLMADPRGRRVALAVNRRTAKVMRAAREAEQRAIVAELEARQRVR